MLMLMVMLMTTRRQAPGEAMLSQTLPLAFALALLLSACSFDAQTDPLRGVDVQATADSLPDQATDAIPPGEIEADDDTDGAEDSGGDSPTDSEASAEELGPDEIQPPSCENATACLGQIELPSNCYAHDCVDGICSPKALPNGTPCQEPGLEPGPCQRGACTDGSCGLVQKADRAACDDGDPCTESDYCTPEGACVGLGKVCPDDDDNPCTIETCVPPTGCVSLALAMDCDTANPLSRWDYCDEGVCTGGLFVASPGGTCDADSDGRWCDDGDANTVQDFCLDQVCQGFLRLFIDHPDYQASQGWSAELVDADWFAVGSTIGDEEALHVVGNATKEGIVNGWMLRVDPKSLYAGETDAAISFAPGTKLSGGKYVGVADRMAVGRDGELRFLKANGSWGIYDSELGLSSVKINSVKPERRPWLIGDPGRKERWFLSTRSSSGEPEVIQCQRGLGDAVDCQSTMIDSSGADAPMGVAVAVPSVSPEGATPILGASVAYLFGHPQGTGPDQVFSLDGQTWKHEHSFATVDDKPRWLDADADRVIREGEDGGLTAAGPVLAGVGEGGLLALHYVDDSYLPGGQGSCAPPGCWFEFANGLNGTQSLYRLGSVDVMAGQVVAGGSRAYRSPAPVDRVTMKDMLLLLIFNDPEVAGSSYGAFALDRVSVFDEIYDADEIGFEEFDVDGTNEINDVQVVMYIDGTTPRISLFAFGKRWDTVENRQRAVMYWRPLGLQ